MAFFQFDANITYVIFNNCPYPIFLVIIVSPGLLFNVLFRLPHVISYNQLPVVFPVRRSCRIFLIRDQIFHSYYLYQMSHSQVSSFLGCFSAALFQFLYGLMSSFPNSALLICTPPCPPQLSNSQFSPFCLFLRFFFSSCHRFFSLSPNFIIFPFHVSPP